MRIRTIKPEFFTHEELFDLEKATGLPLRLSFVGLWCAADREGRFKWEPRRLGVQILPYDQIDFSRVLDALTTRGFIRRYRVIGVDYGVIPSFTSHQVINNREKDSEIPEPLEYIDPDACATREPRDGHATLFPLSGREGKGREGNKEGTREPREKKELSPKEPSKARPENREAFNAYFQTVGLLPRDADYAWEHWEEKGWKNGKEPIKDWQRTVSKWKAANYWPTQKGLIPNEPQWSGAAKAAPAWLPSHWREIAAKIVGSEALTYTAHSEVPRNHRCKFEQACRGLLTESDLDDAPVDPSTVDLLAALS